VLQVTINSLYSEVFSVNTTTAYWPQNVRYMGTIMPQNFAKFAVEKNAGPADTFIQSLTPSGSSTWV